MGKITHFRPSVTGCLMGCEMLPSVMATKLISFRVNIHLGDSIKRRIKDLGYKKPGDYFKSLSRYDLLTAKPHRATGDLHNRSEDQQADFDEGLSEVFLSGATSGGTYFERALKKVMEQTGAEAKPTPSEISKAVFELLEKKK